jgi:hypothetical protein
MANGREAYWLCLKKPSESKFSNAALEKALGRAATMRSATTTQKMAARCIRPRPPTRLRRPLNKRSLANWPRLRYTLCIIFSLWRLPMLISSPYPELEQDALAGDSGYRAQTDLQAGACDGTWANGCPPNMYRYHWLGLTGCKSCDPAATTYRP